MIWMKGLRGCVRPKGLWLVAAMFAAMPAQANDLKVFAAASLTEALDETLMVCTDETGLSATGVYAGSGTIARQIEQGAPADIYISANPQWMDWLEKRGMIADATRIDLVGNELVLISVRKDETLVYLEDSNPDWIDVITGFTTPSKIAIADIQSVPAGIYARQAMERAGLLEDAEITSRLVQASNVREALTWVLRRELGLGLLSATARPLTPNASSLVCKATRRRMCFDGLALPSWQIRAA